MKKKLFIVSGTSRGLGLGIAKAVVSNGFDLICGSRNATNITSDTCNVYSYFLDLSDKNSIQRFFEKIKAEINFSHYEDIVLINNAGVLEPVQFIRKSKLEDMIQNLEVNILGTIALTHSFLCHFVDFHKMVLTVSSGAGKNTYCGWASYCTSKAALDMFMRVLREEASFEKSEKKCLVYSLSPGVIETNMQETIRNKNENDFPMIQKFIDLKNKGSLQTADSVGEKIVSFCIRPNENLGCLININEI